MQTRGEVLNEKIENFRSYLRANTPSRSLAKMEDEILHRQMEEVILYLQANATTDPGEGAATFNEHYSVPLYMQDTVKRYFHCFEYLLGEEVD